jgi:uncharacterized membrane protein
MTSKVAMLVAFLADLVATVVVWPRLPEQVPVHWNIEGQVDRYGAKWELLVFGPGLILGLYVLLVVLKRLDPRTSQPLPADAPPAEAGSRDALIAVALSLLAVIHVSILLQIDGAPFGGPMMMAVGFAGFQLLMGNLMPRVRPNFFVGIRTAWTISSDTVWRRTHRIAGRLLVASGALSLVMVALAPVNVAFPVTIAGMMAALLGPTVASYFFWRAEQRK